MSDVRNVKLACTAQIKQIHSLMFEVPELRCNTFKSLSTSDGHLRLSSTLHHLASVQDFCLSTRDHVLGRMMTPVVVLVGMTPFTDDECRS